jgi:hypothetical protein
MNEYSLTNQKYVTIAPPLSLKSCTIDLLNHEFNGYLVRREQHGH